MGKQNETRYIELNIPQDLMIETAELIEENELDATVVGTKEDEDAIILGFDYSPDQRETIMEIFERIEDFNNGEESEEEED